MTTVAEAFYRDMAAQAGTEDYAAGIAFTEDVEPETQSWFECFMVGVIAHREQRERMKGR